MLIKGMPDREGRLISLVIAVWGFVVALLIAPYGSNLIAYASCGIPIVVGGFGWAWYSLAEENRVIGLSLLNVALAVGSVVALFLITTVRFRNEIAGRSVHGTVIGTERSSNHQYPVVVIMDSGRVIRLEGVAEEFFLMAHTDDRFEKRAGAVVGLLNGKATPILESSLLDMVRTGIR